MKKLILTIFASTGFMFLSFGQYVDQALIFSQQNFGSTARSKAMGNAFGAIGGDFSSLSINPAGIGIYLRPEVSGTLNILGMNNTEATYQGQITDDRNNQFGIRNFGYVIANPVQGGGSGLVSFNFGIGFNKLNNFNQTMAVGAVDSPHSRMDIFAQNTQGIPTSDLWDENQPYQNGTPWESKLAWENYLINLDPNSTGNTYQSILFTDELVNQNLYINREGYNNEWLASFGANFNHQLYLGATVGLQDIHFNESRNYSENGEFGNFDYINNANTRGFGYNLKFGVIYRPVPSLRIGAAVHTPTFFDFKETFYSTMNSDLTNVSEDADGPHSEDTDVGDYEYKMDSPMRAIFSLAWQFEKKGMISIDYEYVDYSKMKLRSGQDGYNFASENTEMKTIYQATRNIRLGGEFRATEALSLRAGYELFGNPYKSFAYNTSQPNKDFMYNTVNAGIGYRINNVFLDVSYSLGNKTDYNYIYPSDDAVKYKMNNNEIVFTLGIKL